MINTKTALVHQIILFIILIILASEQYQYQQKNRTIVQADIVISVPIPQTTSATPTPTIPNAQENPSTKPTNAKITILATSTKAPNNSINNTLAIEILSTITAALSIIAIILGICIKRARQRKLAYKRNLRTQVPPIGTSQAPFTSPIDLNNINVEQLAQQLAQLQNLPPRYNK